MFTSHTRHTEYLTHLVVFAALFFLHTTLTFAADEKFVPMVHLPGIAGDAVPLPVYINRTYMLTISIGAFIGVIKLSIAGVKYAMSDVVTDKSSAKKDIMGVFLGLAILLVPFIVLKQINPDLVKLELLKGASNLDTSSISPTATPLPPRQIETDAGYVLMRDCQIKSGTYNTYKKTCENVGVGAVAENCVKWGGYAAVGTCNTPEFGAGGVYANTSVTPELLKEWEGICASARQDLMVNINKGEASTNYQCYAKP